MMRKLIIVIIILAVIAGVLVPVLFDPSFVYAASKTIYANSDVNIWSYYPDNNYGTVPMHHVGRGAPGADVSRSLVGFFVDWGVDIPDGSTITSAIMYLYYFDYVYDNPVGRTIDAHRCLRSFGEHSSTWNKWRSTEWWTTPGCGSSVSDYTNTGKASAIVPGSFGWMNWDITAQVQWAQSDDSPVRVRLSDSEEQVDYISDFYSREYDSGSKSPMLVITYTSPSAATITTSPATLVTSTSARLPGAITATGGNNPTVTVFWGDNDGGTNPIAWDYDSVPTSPSQPQGVASFYKNIAGLTPGKTYYFRARAVNSGGTSWASATRTFVTDAIPPTVTTQTPTGETCDTALAHGTITSDGGSTITRRGFCYKVGTTGDPTTSDSVVYENGSFGTGSYSLTISDLTVCTNYRVRAYAVNDAGTSYGSTITTITVCTPSCTTNDAAYIGVTTARLNGYLNSDGGESCEYHFQYGYASGVYTFETTWTDAKTTGQYFHENIASLLPDTDYYFRAQVRNCAGTVSGSEKSFTTEWALLPPSNLDAHATSGTEISLSWIRGSGVDNTLIQMKAGSYPTNTTDGNVAYFGKSSSTSISDLLPGTSYYFSAWSESAGNYSVNYTQAMTTTLPGITPDTPDIPTQPSNWFLWPDHTKLSNIPFNGQINSLFNAYGLPYNTGWTLLALFLAALLGAVAYFASNGEIWIALITLSGVIIFESFIGMVGLWVILFVVIIGGTYAFIRSRAT